MNVNDMLDFIRKNDNSDGNVFTYTADFLMGQHLMGRLNDENLWHMLRDIMILIVTCSSYLVA